MWKLLIPNIIHQVWRCQMCGIYNQWCVGTWSFEICSIYKKYENPPSKYGFRNSRLSMGYMGYIIIHGLYYMIQVECGLYGLYNNTWVILYDPGWVWVILCYITLTKLDGYNAIWEIQSHVFHCQHFGHKVNTTTFALSSINVCDRMSSDLASEQSILWNALV